MIIPNDDSLRKGICKLPLFVYNIDSFGYELGDIIGPKYETKRRIIPPLNSVFNSEIHSSWQDLLDFLYKCKNNQKVKSKKRKIIIDDD